MKRVVLEFDDEEMELLEEQFKQIQDVAGMETIEDYIYYATMSHCKTMQAASKMFGQSGDIEKLMADENVHVGVVNMPIQLSNVEDKDEFSRYLNDVLNDAEKARECFFKYLLLFEKTHQTNQNDNFQHNLDQTIESIHYQ